MNNLTKPPCENKCTEDQNEQCSNCLIPAVEQLDADFAVGDMVVLTDVCTAFHSDELFTLEAKSISTLWSASSKNHFILVTNYEIRHATRAEIKANKRLPDLVTLFVPDFDDTDVEKYHQRALMAQKEVP